MNLTLGGFRPGSAYHVLPSRHQLWWKPCLRRSETGDTHCWYLSPTSDGSLLCWHCRVGAPRVVKAAVAVIAAIRDALEAGDMRTAQRLAFGPAEPAAPVAGPRFADLADWTEFWKERAAMFEYLGGADRDESERMARELAGAPP